MFQVNNEGNQTTLLLTYSMPFSGFSIVDFEKVNAYSVRNA